MDKRDGCGWKADFVKVGGNDTNAEALIEAMIDSGLIVAKNEGGRTCYEKTDSGKLLHQIMKSNDRLGPLIELLGRKRLKRKKDDDEEK